MAYSGIFYGKPSSDGAKGFFKDGHPNKNNSNNNKMGSVSDPKINLLHQALL